MSRFAETLIKPGVSGLSLNNVNPMIDPRFGGSNGHSFDYTQWASLNAYIPKNVILFVLETPKGFDYLPPAEKKMWVEAYKAIIELHPKTVSGFASGIELDVVENAVGGAGQMFEDFVNATQARTQPNLTWLEKYGMVFGNFWSTFIRMFMMNPETKYADIMTIAGTRPTDQLADLYSGTILAVEPDATLLNPVNAWLMTNFWPRTSGPIEGKRDLTSPSETRDVDIQFAALTQQGNGVKALARQILQNVNIIGANPHNRPAFVSGISADVQAANNGYKANVEKLGAQANVF